MPVSDIGAAPVLLTVTVCTALGAFRLLETVSVVGDGASTIEHLIETQINTDPRRGVAEHFPLDLIKLDSPRGEMSLLEIQRQGYGPKSVLPKGESIVVQRNGNLSTDVTDQVHPEVAAMATLAARVIGLDIAGIDMVTRDISRPLTETQGAIIEVNAGPGLLMHVKPAVGQPRPVGQAIVDHLFGPNDSGRIPVIGIAGDEQPTRLAQLVAWLVHLSGRRTGLACQDGLFMNQHRVEAKDARNFESSERLLINRALDAAVIETSALHILDEGLAYDRCHVGVVTDFDGYEALSTYDIQAAEQMHKVLRTQIDVVLADGFAVLNAADPHVAMMANMCSGNVTFFAVDPHHPVIATHRAQGKRVVYTENGFIVAQQGKKSFRIPLAEVPLTRQGQIGFQTENVMAAVAAAWAVDVPWETIALGLSTFISDIQGVPGRFNVFDYKGATLIADYGHNPDAIQALVQAVDNMPAQKRVVVISGAGDRRDQDIRDQTQILGTAFDEVILYQDACQRGRSDGEVIQLLREGLNGATRTTHVQDIQGEFNAIDTALARLSDGDLCLILIDQVEAALAYIQGKVNESQAAVA